MSIRPVSSALFRCGIPIVFAGALFCMAASSETFLETQFPVSSLAIMAGNGGLTVGADAAGIIAAVSWPSPGYCVQTAAHRRLADEEIPAMPGALFWAVRVAGETHWLHAPPWRLTAQAWPEPGIPIVEARFALDTAPDVEAVQTWFVHPSLDLLAVRLDIRGMQTPFDLFWAQYFEPRVQTYPVLPLAEMLFPSMRGFAVFADTSASRLLYFRPQEPGRADWTRATTLAARHASSAEWAAFGKGTWIAAATTNPVIAHQVGRPDAPDSAALGVDQGRLRGASAAIAPADAAWQLQPAPADVAMSAIIYVAFGEDWEAVARILSAAGAQGYEALRQETEQYWRYRIAAAPAACAVPASRDALAAMLLCTSRNSGAVVRTPASGTPFSVVTPQQAAWVSLALNMAGLHEEAAHLLAFLANTQRKTGRIGTPRGSLPAAVYASGEEAVPQAILQVEAAAWLLGALWAHAGFLMDSGAAQLFLAGHLDTVCAAADYLASWVQDGEVTRFLSFDPIALRERQSVAALLHVYTGLSAAMHIGAALNYPQPEDWAARRRELKSAIQFHLLNAAAPLPLALEFPYWMRRIVARDQEARWDVWDAIVSFDGVERRLWDAAAPAYAFSADAPTDLTDTLRQALRLIAIIEAEAG